MMLSEISRQEVKILVVTDIEAQIKEIQERRKAEQAEEDKDKGIGLLESGYFDSDLYDGNGTQKGKYEGYVTSIAPNEDEDEDDDEPIRPSDKRTTGFGAPMAFINDIARVSEGSLFKIDFTINFFNRASLITIHLKVVDQRQSAKRKTNIDRNDANKFCHQLESTHLLTVSFDSSRFH